MVARFPEPCGPPFPQFPPQPPCGGGGPIHQLPFPFPGQDGPHGGHNHCPHHGHHHHHHHGGGGHMPLDPLSFLGGSSGGARGGGFLV